ncbi:MAG: thioredoxin-dependent thiol peroxidase [Candidatus Latescibacterota bacterium]
MACLQAGDKAPEFSLTDQNGNTVSLSDFRGKLLLVYFYPKADTPGCTRQACSIRDAMPDLKSIGIAAVGVSPDKPAAQKKFDEKYGLGFPLLADTEHTAAEAYGVWGEKIRCGKASIGITRSSFLVNEEGSIVQAWYSVKPEDTVPKALDEMGKDFS